MPRRSFYDINQQVATKFPDYDQADFEKARSTIRGPEYSASSFDGSNRYQNSTQAPNRANLRSIKMQEKNGAERGAPDEIAK